MRLMLRSVPPKLADKKIQRIVVRDVVAALRKITTKDDAFVINSTIWYRRVKNKITPRVANEAGFISSSFQSAPEYPGSPWVIEKEIEGQRIDAYAEFECSGGVTLTLKDLSDWIPKSGCSPEEAASQFCGIYGSYVQRSIFSDGGLPKDLRVKSKTNAIRHAIRVGVEFETGNIASSFRALLKLNLLFRLGKIDVGVFVTSNSKVGAAAAIWPSSNRNGSFDELAMRRWREVIDIPILGIGFEPDRFDSVGPVLRKNGAHKVLLPTGKRVQIGARAYEIWRCPGDSTDWLQVEKSVRSSQKEGP